MSLRDIVDEKLYKKLASCSLAQQRTYEAGEFIYREGEKPENIFLIVDGLVGLVNMSMGGQETLLRVFGNDYIFGHRSLIAQENYHASALVLRKTNVITLCFHSPQDIIDNMPEFFPYISMILAKELKYAEQRFSDLTSKKVTSRIIESLLFLKSRYPDYKWTRREIGEFCGAQTETVTRALTKLEKEGLIEKKGRDILIVDEQALFCRAENCID